MPALEALRRAITTTQELRTIVTTMKALAAVSHRQYERAVAALADCDATIEAGMQVALRNEPAAMERLVASVGPHLAVISIGTDFGMVGQFNERVAAHTAAVIADARSVGGDHRLLAIGERVATALADARLTVDATLPTPGSAAGVTPVILDALAQVEAWRERGQAHRLVLIYSQARADAHHRPTNRQVLPVEAAWLRGLAARPWPSRRLPIVLAPSDGAWAALLRHYLFVALYRACAESLASEHASRLAAMQRAERHLEERFDSLTTAMRQQRQAAIMAELLDLVAGTDVALGRRR
jgi:F-type H+-transporting ATPase subunit gamma